LEQFLSYLYTFGVLPDDNYTLVLRSAANAFVDDAGVPLDGTNSGNPAGTNFTTTFSTSYNASDVSLTIGSFACGPAQTVSLVVPLSNPTIYYPGVPIQLTDGNNVTTAGFTLTYNTALLSVTGVVVDTSGAYASAPPGSTFTRTSHMVVNGLATDVFAFSTAGHDNLGTGHGPVTIGELTATIPNTSGQQIYKAKEVLAISGATANGALPVVGAVGLQVVAYPADASGDGAYAGNDASLVGRVAGGQDTGFAAYPLVDPVILADVAGEGTVTANDASQVAQTAVHRSVPNLPPVPAGAQVLPSTAPDPLLSIPASLRVSSGGTVSVPVNLDETRPAGSTGLTEATLALRFDPLVFMVSSSDIHLGSIPQAGSGWTLSSSVDDVTGQIGITLYSLMPIASNLAGSLVMIDFHAQPGVAVETSLIQLAASVDPSGHGSYVTNVGDSNGAMILGLLPTNVANLAIDATVVMLASQVSVTTVPTTTAVAVSVEQQAGVQTLSDTDGGEASATEKSGAPTSAVKPAASAPSLAVLAASQAGGLLLQFGTHAALAPLVALWADQQLADRVYLAMARASADLTDQLPVRGAAQDAMSQYLGSQPIGSEMQSGQLDGSRWDGLDLSADFAPAGTGADPRGTIQQRPAMQSAMNDASALSQYFAGLAEVADADGVDDE
jgi:hypothetical protein